MFSGYSAIHYEILLPSYLYVGWRRSTDYLDSWHGLIARQRPEMFFQQRKKCSQYYIHVYHNATWNLKRVIVPIFLFSWSLSNSLLPTITNKRFGKIRSRHFYYAEGVSQNNSFWGSLLLAKEVSRLQWKLDSYHDPYWLIRRQYKIWNTFRKVVLIVKQVSWVNYKSA